MQVSKDPIEDTNIFNLTKNNKRQISENWSVLRNHLLHEMSDPVFWKK